MIDESAPDTPRWVQRFRNFDSALVLLREGVALLEGKDVHPIVGEGVIQRFEFTFELAWKTLKDFMVDRQVTLERTGPGDVLRTAFATGYIDDGETWLAAFDARNEMSHVYGRQAHKRVLDDLRLHFLNRFEALHDMLLNERVRLERA